MFVNRSFNLFSIISAGFGLAARQRPFLKVEGEVPRSDKGLENFWFKNFWWTPKPNLSILERTASGVTRSHQAAAQSTARSFSRSVLFSSQRYGQLILENDSHHLQKMLHWTIPLDKRPAQEDGPDYFLQFFLTFIFLKAGLGGWFRSVAKIIALPQQTYALNRRNNIISLTMRTSSLKVRYVERRGYLTLVLEGAGLGRTYFRRLIWSWPV